MEEPVVKGWDPALDITRCKGRFILQIPPGAERGLRRRAPSAGDHRLHGASGRGRQRICLSVGGRRRADRRQAGRVQPDTVGRSGHPRRSIEGQSTPEASEPTEIAEADVPAPLPRRRCGSIGAGWRTEGSSAARSAANIRSGAQSRNGQRSNRVGHSGCRSTDEAGEGAVRAFYDALGAGDGTTASAQIIPEKRSSRAFSPEGLSRFYGALPEPIRITEVVPLTRGAYRVSYRYSAGRSRCNGSAVVSLTNRRGRDLIRSIKALNGC